MTPPAPRGTSRAPPALLARHPPRPRDSPRPSGVVARGDGLLAPARRAGADSKKRARRSEWTTGPQSPYDAPPRTGPRGDLRGVMHLPCAGRLSGARTNAHKQAQNHDSLSSQRSAFQCGVCGSFAIGDLSRPRSAAGGSNPVDYPKKPEGARGARAGLGPDERAKVWGNRGGRGGETKCESLRTSPPRARARCAAVPPARAFELG